MAVRQRRITWLLGILLMAAFRGCGIVLGEGLPSNQISWPDCRGWVGVLGWGHGRGTGTACPHLLLI